MVIDTVHKLIDEMGGPKKAATVLGVVPSAVTNMRRRGWVPPRHVLTVQKLAKRKRWVVSDALFERQEG